ncbi:hypothetical protein FGO68_gene4245 [Halteria grandinella]|uniref:Uncharacterized protein n=1 Tax=Halteria grandinella TaxID=5974 RepID=A0A8J8P3A6_HALGN|nr:hypothetical protein FGO68_gene4245 [Halteria grandinella]
MAEIKRSLWEVDRREGSFKRHMNILHTDFANKIIVRKKEQALIDIAEKLQAERDSMRSPRLTERSKSTRRNVKGGVRGSLTGLIESQIMSHRKNSTNSQRYYVEENHRPRAERLLVKYQSTEQTNPYQAPPSAQATSMLKGRLSRLNIPIKRDNQVSSETRQQPLQFTAQLPSLIAQVKLVQILDKELIKKKKQEQIQRLIDKFKYLMSLTKSDVSYSDPTRLDITNKEWCRMLLHSDLSFLSFQQFRQLLKVERILTPIARELQFIHGFDKFSREELEDALSQCDKDLFLQLRDKVISYDQLRARVAERQGIATYKVFDDIKGLLNPSILEKLEKQKLRKQAQILRMRKQPVLL